MDKYQIELDRNVIDELNLNDTIIEGKFTFSLKDRTEFISRKDVGISEDSFVVCMVGARLNKEISDEIWTEIEQLLIEDYNVEVALIGGFDGINEVVAKYPKLEGKIKNLGFCTDALSRIDLCDLYINPIRKGGATSAVEAMSLGVPVLTVNYGDVAGTVGQEFYCETVSDYVRIIEKYINDKSFYLCQSKLAKEKADILTDSDTEFLRVIDEYLRRRKLKKDRVGKE